MRNSPIQFTIITLFPEMFEPVFGSSMLWKATNQNLVKFNLINLRDYGIGPRHQVDDSPYGGGDGMLMRCEPIFGAVKYAHQITPNAKVLLMTPKGKIWRVDSIVRLIPGVLGGETSAEIESFSEGDNFEYPQYTRPETFQGMSVPSVLLSGNHAAIAQWRAENSPTSPAIDFLDEQA